MSDSKYHAPLLTQYHSGKEDEVSREAGKSQASIFYLFLQGRSQRIFLLIVFIGKFTSKRNLSLVRMKVIFLVIFIHILLFLISVYKCNTCKIIYYFSLYILFQSSSLFEFEFGKKYVYVFLTKHNKFTGSRLWQNDKSLDLGSSDLQDAKLFCTFPLSLFF